MLELIDFFIHILLISVTSYSGSAQSLFYDVGVEQLQWISNQAYISYLGFGFASPGPQVFSLATFMGYGHSGLLGAVLGTLGIYIMPVLFAILSGKYLARWIHNPGVQSFVKTIGIAAAGLLASIGIKIVDIQNTSFVFWLIAAAAAIAAIKKVNPIFIIISGLLLGILLQQ